MSYGTGKAVISMEELAEEGRRRRRRERCCLTDAVQAVDGHGLEGAAHHGVFLQHLVEVVHGQGEEAAVGVGTDAGCAPALRQQTDLCVAENRRKKSQEEEEKWPLSPT